jgi:Zn-dependent protease with chaperone function
MMLSALLDVIASPPIVGVIGASAVIGGGLLAERLGRDDWAADRFFVLLIATLGGGATLALAWALKAALPANAMLDAWGARPWVVDPRLWIAAVGYGGAVLLVRRLIGTVSVAWQIRRSRGPSYGLQRVFASCMDEIRPRMPARLVVTDRPGTPYVTGLGRATVVVPREVEALDAASQRLILLHELAHVARRDAAAQLGTQLAGVFLWWNPLFWMMQRRLAVLRESACDTLATYYARDTDAYVGLLMRFARSGRRPLGLGFTQVPMATPGTLRQRVRAFEPQPKLGRRWPVFLPTTASRADVVAVCVTCVVAFAALDLIGRHTLAGDPAAPSLLD